MPTPAVQGRLTAKLGTVGHLREAAPGSVTGPQMVCHTVGGFMTIA